MPSKTTKKALETFGVGSVINEVRTMIDSMSATLLTAAIDHLQEKLVGCDNQDEADILFAAWHRLIHVQHTYRGPIAVLLDKMLEKPI